MNIYNSTKKCIISLYVALIFFKSSIKDIKNKHNNVIIFTDQTNYNLIYELKIIIGTITNPPPKDTGANMIRSIIRFI